MKQKRIFIGMFSLILALGLGLVLTSCGDQTAEIVVTNNSPFEVDDNATVRVHMRGRSDPLSTKQFARGETVTFSQDEGEYQVRVTTGNGYSSYYYPQDGSFINISGEVKLRFNGNSVTRN